MHVLFTLDQTPSVGFEGRHTKYGFSGRLSLIKPGLQVKYVRLYTKRLTNVVLALAREGVVDGSQYVGIATQ